LSIDISVISFYTFRETELFVKTKTWKQNKIIFCKIRT